MKFTTPMSLSFGHTRVIGDRGSEKKIMECRSSSVPHKFNTIDYKNHFTSECLNAPKPYWVSTDELNESASTDIMSEEVNIERAINDSEEITFFDDMLNSSSNFNNDNVSESLCDELDD